MTFTIRANLDQEALWSGQPLPAKVLTRISAASGLLAALAPDGADAEVWTPVDVPAWRMVATPRWTPPTMRVGIPPAHDLAWAQPDAKPANDRRVGVEVARDAGHGLPGTRVIESIDELVAHLEAGGAAASPTRGWVCKAPWTSAGRDRCFGTGTELPTELRTHVAKLLAHHHALVFEPWLDRIADFGVCASVDPAGGVTLEAPHRIATTTRGGFRGIELTADALEIAEHDQLLIAAEHAGVALHRAHYTGPFGIDAFVYKTEAGTRALHPLCEINARFTFGHVARALGKRLGITTLGFGPPPDGATVLVQESALDPTITWVY